MYRMPPEIKHRPTTANTTPANRPSSEGKIGGPCHAVTRAGTFCTRKATVVAEDGYGYCKCHAGTAR